MNAPLSKELIELAASVNVLARRIAGEEMMLPLLREVAYAAHEMYKELHQPFAHGSQLNALDRLRKALEAAGFDTPPSRVYEARPSACSAGPGRRAIDMPPENAKLPSDFPADSWRRPDSKGDQMMRD